jgi:hypothetical protein
MLKQLQHKRFTNVSALSQMQDDLLLSTECHWCAQSYSSIEPIGNLNDRDHRRPCYIHT